MGNLEVTKNVIDVMVQMLRIRKVIKKSQFDNVFVYNVLNTYNKMQSDAIVIFLGFKCQLNKELLYCRQYVCS